MGQMNSNNKQSATQQMDGSQFLDEVFLPSRTGIKIRTWEEMQKIPLSLKKCLKLDHITTITIIQENFLKMQVNQTIQQIYDMHQQVMGIRWGTFFLCAGLSKVGTSLLHRKRSTALSAPRTKRVFLLKYLLFPLIMSGMISASAEQIQSGKLVNSMSDKRDVADEIFKEFWYIEHLKKTQMIKYSYLTKKYQLEDLLAEL